ncbi:hypothetical protein P3X46_006028 [Hevea brasiliensis]|uniref:HMA domain-containing protein n=1 Tax=Hevea brasiliensis TaxID=3981 RepID=A0ABQ9MSU4_HEVBR|nr:heavy metal-associated isoprenylated plant protein 19 [Hevea brasiliensis]KAJ9181988.1 hypothetical protein P3X46_006028 [Hevea brasiliensis]
MANEEKNDQREVKMVEFKVSMYCNACERTVAKTISKFKGVETFATDMNKHKVVVTGCMDPQKLLEKLKKKTRKKVEIIEKEKEEAEEEKKEEKAPKENLSDNQENEEPKGVEGPPYFLDYCKEEVFMTFSDENPNACSVM